MAECTASEVADAIDPRRYGHGDKERMTVPCDELIAAADMLRSREWRPISEAPRDGTKVLVCNSPYDAMKYDLCQVAMFVGGAWVSSWDHDLIYSHDAELNKPGDTWYFQSLPAAPQEP